MATIEEMRAEEDGWWSGYQDGQSDALTWLAGKMPPDAVSGADVPMAPQLTPGLGDEYAMWCLGRNLAVAGAMQAMFDLGAYHEFSVQCREVPEWEPNTEGRRAP